MKRIKKFTMFVSEVSTLLTFPHTWTWENDENYKEYKFVMNDEEIPFSTTIAQLHPPQTFQAES